MADHPDFITACRIVKAQGAHADIGGRDSHGHPTYQLRLTGGDGALCVLVGCRFDQPAVVLERVARARARR